MRLSRGFKHRPHYFNKVLNLTVAGIGQMLDSTVVQYVDDIIICSPDEDTCHKDSIKFLAVVGRKGTESLSEEATMLSGEGGQFRSGNYTGTQKHF